MIEFVVNQKTVRVDVEKDTPLLWVLRENLNLVGTKFGCGVAMCGACTVHMNGQAIRSCVTKVGEIAGRDITTIEGLKGEHPLQHAWVAESVPQCGYCQPGQIMQAAALLSARPAPTDDDIDHAMAGNLCRCGTYQRIRKAIHRAAGQPVASTNRRVLRVVQGVAEKNADGSLAIRAGDATTSTTTASLQKRDPKIVASKTQIASRDENGGRQ